MFNKKTLSYIRDLTKNSNKFEKILKENRKFNSFVKKLAKNVPSDIRKEYIIACNQIRRFITTKDLKLEQTIGQSLSTYTPLLFVLTGYYFPRSAAFRTTTIIPMSSPTQAVGIIRPQNVDLTGTKQLSGKNTITNVGSSGINLNTSIQRGAKIISVSNGSKTIPVNIPVNPDGTFLIRVNYGGQPDVITGYVDFKTGRVKFTSKNKVTQNVQVSYNQSQELNEKVNEVGINIDTIPLNAKTYKLSAKVSPEFEYDVKKLFGVNAIEELANIIVNQIIVDIDKEIISNYLSGVKNTNNIETFNKTPPSNFAGSLKMWYSNLTVSINRVISRIVLPFNYIYALVNPLDGAMLRGIRLGRIILLESQLVPVGNIIVVPKITKPETAIYLLGLYLPPILLPNLPAGNLKSMTIMARLGHTFVRPDSIGLVRVQ